MSKLPRSLRFEDAMRKLDEIVAVMESGEVGIEESIAKYEEAMRLAQHCRQILDKAEERIRLIRTDGEGAPLVTEFDPPDAGSAPRED